MSTTTQFDLDRFARATEERDASTQLSMYAPQATVTIVDKITRPGSPRVLTGTEEIKGWIEDLTARDMTHSVGHAVSSDAGAAYAVDCRYPDGTKVLCAALMEVAGGAIASQTIVQVWDEN
ncbi:MAG TPA: nuclear transport factor 2 family protein [Solirubrobacteraceae bacterium]|nr:nuclear transport factor 2 family protein [Solirubrobacteraceae bacterium]